LIIIYVNRYNLEAECELLLITGLEVLNQWSWWSVLGSLTMKEGHWFFVKDL